MLRLILVSFLISCQAAACTLPINWYYSDRVMGVTTTGNLQVSIRSRFDPLGGISKHNAAAKHHLQVLVASFAVQASPEDLTADFINVYNKTKMRLYVAAICAHSTIIEHASKTSVIAKGPNQVQIPVAMIMQPGLNGRRVWLQAASPAMDRSRNAHIFTTAFLAF